LNRIRSYRIFNLRRLWTDRPGTPITELEVKPSCYSQLWC